MKTNNYGHSDFGFWAKVTHQVTKAVKGDSPGCFSEHHEPSNFLTLQGIQFSKLLNEMQLKKFFPVK